ncbi:TetR/AcrR family transcriptional regulator [Paenibacillus tyrfis]|uniref:TetR/AcrR family transcriptional regulator n=1 Tax=Paenibacillus tyrfis TaxID=1501230 RepID=UPI0020A21218|nr:TetR/AcrR family transcriptional regulator [Paenibacillus tyrfis]MCP1306160.1 TetR/AcrR family transcriptional regulator [Paenibacillus tyrfis]
MAVEKRDKIVESALKLFEQKGYHSTKVSDIVKDAGMAQGTFYLYFKSKEDLFRSVAEECLKEIVVALEPKSLDPRELHNDKMHDRLIRQTLTIYYQNRTILNILKRHGAASPEIADISKQFYGNVCEVVKDMFKHFNVYPGYTDEQLEMTAYAEIGMLEMVAYQWFIEKGYGLEKLDPLAEVLVGINVNCLPETDVSEG